MVGFEVEGDSGGCDRLSTGAWPLCLLVFLEGVVGGESVEALCIGEEASDLGDVSFSVCLGRVFLLPVAAADIETFKPLDGGGGDKEGILRRMKSSSVREGGDETDSVKGDAVTFQTIWSSSEDKSSEITS